MAVPLNQKEVIQYCNDLLNIEFYTDYGPNGMQVEGDNRDVKNVAFGVSMTEEFIEKSLDEKADLLITHHGMLWDRDERVITGPFKRKLKLLLESGVAAAAYHLPLDFHPFLGNNAQLASKFKLQNTKGFCETPKYAEGIIGIPEITQLEPFTELIESELKRKPTVIASGLTEISSVAIITGGAQSYFKKAIDAGADCYITGEMSEMNYAMAQEHGVVFISAGHYASEQFGVQALGKHMRMQLNINDNFIGSENPI